MPSTANDVTVFYSGRAGMPAFNAGAGTLVAVLDACLVNGIGLTPITGLTVVGGVATVTVASNGLFQDVIYVCEVAGASHALLNGRKRPTGVANSTTQFTFDATGVPDGTYMAGTPTVKQAPLGWGIHRTATNKRMYKSLNPLSNGIKLRCDDTNTATYWNATANVAGTYRAMARMSIAYNDSSIDSYQGDYPCWWIKDYMSTPTHSPPYMIVGDDRGFYINYLQAGQLVMGRVDYFGEMVGLTRPGDAYGTILTGYDQANVTSAWNGGGASSNSRPLNTLYNDTVGSSLVGFSTWIHAGAVNNPDIRMIARGYAQTNFTLSRFELRGHAAGTAYVSNNAPYMLHTSGFYGYAYPNAQDNGLQFAENLAVYEINANGVRGYMPGYAQVLHKSPIGNWMYVHKNMPNAPGRMFITMCGMGYAYNVATNNAAHTGEVMIDCLGPWR